MAFIFGGEIGTSKNFNSYVRFIILAVFQTLMPFVS